MKLKGAITPVVTPFDDKEEVNVEVLRSIVDYLIRGGVSGLFPVGTAGAFFLLTPEEKKRVASIVVEQAKGRIPVYVGTCGITARENIELAKHAKDIGADAVVFLTPYYVKVSDDELFQYFTTMAEAADMDVIMYSNPGRSGNSISATLLERIVKENSNIIGMKDSSGDLAQFEDYVLSVGKKISLIMGKDELMLASLAVGGSGFVSAVSNILPELAADIYNSFLKGDIENARKSQHKLNILKKSFGGTAYPAPLLAALDLLGIKGGKPRSPVLPLKNEQKEKIRQALKSLSKLQSTSDY